MTQEQQDYLIEFSKDMDISVSRRMWGGTPAVTYCDELTADYGRALHDLTYLKGLSQRGQAVNF